MKQLCFHGPAERQRARYGRAEGKRRDEKASPLVAFQRKIHKKPVDFQSIILYTIKHDTYRVFLEANVENTIPEAIPTKEASDKLEDTACLEIIKATLATEYAKQENERDEALLEDAWAAFTEITGIKTSFSSEEIDERIKTIIEESRA